MVQIVNVIPDPTGAAMPRIAVKDDREVFPESTVRTVLEWLKGKEPEFTVTPEPAGQLISPAAAPKFVIPQGTLELLGKEGLVPTEVVQVASATAKVEFECGTAEVILLKNKKPAFKYHFIVGRTRAPYKGEVRYIVYKFLYGQPMTVN